MRKVILILILTYCTFVAIAQAPTIFNFQSVITDQNNVIIKDQKISLRFSILENKDSETPIYEESHTISTDKYGMVNIKFGEGDVIAGDINSIDWGNNNYHIEIAADFSGGNNYTLIANKQLLSAPITQYSDKTKFAALVNYEKLNNKPQLITEDQISKFDLITVTDSINLDSIQKTVNKNLTADLIEFPGFGETAGKAFPIYWAETDNGLFYEKGGVVINDAKGKDLKGSVLSIKGGILNANKPNEIKPGLIFYAADSTNEFGQLGNFYYYDNDLRAQSFTEEIGILYNMYFVDSTSTIGDQVILDDMIHIGRMGIGSTIKPGYEFGENNMVLVDSVIVLKFEDTSNSGSFPSSDWAFEINDPNNVNGNYFAFKEVTTGRTPFKLTAQNSSFILIDEEGNIGFGVHNPIAKLEITGTVSDTIIGNASKLTGISDSGTGLTENIGSTTIEADNDNNSTGDIIFQTQNTDKMVIASNGNVALGKPISEKNLDVAGDLIIQDLTAEDNLYITKSLIHSISTVTDADLIDGFYIDAAGKDIIKVQTTAPSFNIFLQNIKKGQKITLINIGSNVLTINVGTYPTNSSIIINSIGSATITFDGTSYLCIDQVQ